MPQLPVELTVPLCRTKPVSYTHLDTLRPEGSNTIDRWAGGFDEEGQLLPPPDAYFDPLAQCSDPDCRYAPGYRRVFQE